MRRSRTLILLGVVLLLAAVAAFVLANQNQPALETPSPDGPTPEPTAVIRTVPIVVAAQNIPRGRAITEDAVILVDWPETSLPPGAFTNLEDVQNLIARTDILFNQPLTDVMLTSDRAQLTSRGSDASLLIPNDRRAVAVPIDQLASVGYALQPGDHVDVLVSLWLLDADREGQYAAYLFNRNLSDELVAAGLPPEAAVQQAVALTTRDRPYPRLSSQMILQDLEVLSVGDWTEPTPIPRITPGPEGEIPTPTPGVAPGATPTGTPPRPNVVILIVAPQQALILQWLRESDAIIDLALRGATDRAPVDTSTVTLQYLFDSFNVTLPPKLDFAVNYLPSAQAAACPDRWTKDSCR
ncbi:MAG TPA: Flp pilus assembly protein CpaB [Anaerolineae bacterium]|nr:Flp pilus assembly protein CpaB [Anaerolineae bacterium]